MKFSLIALTAATAVGVAVAAPPPPSKECAAPKDIIVDRAPDHLRAYMLPRFRGRHIRLTKTQTVTYSITANSSDGAFTLVQHNGKVSHWLNARPHTHKRTHEHFYCTRGRCGMWSKKENSTTATDEARIGSFGDYGNVPPDTMHTFELLDPDTQLTHVFHPAGFEQLFEYVNLGDFESEVGAPFNLEAADEQPFGPMTDELRRAYEPLDLYAVPEEIYVPRHDFLNDTAGSLSLPWHNGTNQIPESATEPYYIARDYGPKYLNFDKGFGYKIIQPLTTPKQTAYGNFTMGTVTMSSMLHNETASTANLPNHFALQMLDGFLELKIQGYKPTHMIQGDVAFIPANTTFEYSTRVPFTKFMYLNAGAKGLDYKLLSTSVPWGFVSYPVFAGYKA